MEYFVAKSYEDAKWISEPTLNEKGKMVVKIRMRCKRCGGSGHYLYNQMDGTRCYGCNGSGYQTDWVRAYTEKERAALDRAAVRAKERKEEARQAKIKANIDAKAEKMQAWYAKNGFNENGISYIVLGNTYDIKEELKEKGFRYNELMGWHGSSNEYPSVEVSFEELYDWIDAAGYPNIKEGAYNIVIEKKKSAENFSASGHFIGEVKERLRNLKLSLILLNNFESRFGYCTLLKFKDNDGNIFTWYTSTVPQVKIGDTLLVTGTVKEHKVYNNEKETVLTRCKIEKEVA